MGAYIHAILGATARMLIVGIVQAWEQIGLRNRKRLVTTRATFLVQLQASLRWSAARSAARMHHRRAQGLPLSPAHALLVVMPAGIIRSQARQS